MTVTLPSLVTHHAVGGIVSGRRRVTTRRWLPILGPGLLMLTLGTLGSTVPVLSWDEIATADVAHRSVTQIWNLVHHIDAVFGPYYLFMHLWTTLAGDSVLSLRLPSILAMAAAVGLSGELGRRLFGPTAGTVAGVLICLLPNISRYAAEARPYALACFFSILALVLLHRALERPSPGRWIAYAASVAGLGLCSLIALTALAGHLVPVLFSVRRSRSPWRSRTLPWCAAVMGSLLVVAPMMWWGLHQRQAQLYWVPPLTLGGVYTFPAQLVGWPEVAWLLIGLLVPALGLRGSAVVAMAAAAALPTIVVAAVSIAGPSFWVNRYLLFVVLPAAIVAAAGLTRIPVGPSVPGRLLALATVLTVFAAAAVPGQIAVRQPAVKNGSDYRALAAVIRQRQQPGDDIVYQKGRTMRAGVGYYLRHDRGGPDDVLLRRSAAEAATLTAIEYADPVARLAAAERIWLVAYGRRSDPATSRHDLSALLAGHFRLAAVWTVKLGTLGLYVRLNPRPNAADQATRAR